MTEEELETEKENIRNNLMEAKIIEKIDALMEDADIVRYAENIE